MMDEAVSSLLPSRPWPRLEQLKVFHIGAYWRGENDVVHQLMVSLRSLGPEVYEYNTDEHRDVLDCEGRVYNRGGSGPVWLRWEMIRPEIEAFDPDLIICDGGGVSFRPEVARHLRQKVALMGVAWSDPDVFEQTTRYIAPTFDLYLTNYAEYVPRYTALGAWAAALPYATNDEYWRPVARRPEFECDVVVLGHAHPARIEPVRALAKNFNLHLYGEDWEPHGLTSRGTLVGEDLMSAVHSATFTLVTNTTIYGTPVVKIVMLDFIAAGALIITNDFEPTKRYLEYDKEIIGFSSTADLVEKVRYYLDHPEEAEAIRRAAHARVLRDYRWKSFWPGLLEQVAAVRRYVSAIKSKGLSA
jgi:spore maturation protein CgeB